mmetsp:Transcript_6575/g.16012  ORF Transcript_6575/g.16012 Transcript_6575/m.16012 type:complete len:262 (+) Transcript_6575:902-1687(+)
MFQVNEVANRFRNISTQTVVLHCNEKQTLLNSSNGRNRPNKVVAVYVNNLQRRHRKKIGWQRTGESVDTGIQINHCLPSVSDHCISNLSVDQVILDIQLLHLCEFRKACNVGLKQVVVQSENHQLAKTEKAGWDCSRQLIVSKSKEGKFSHRAHRVRNSPRYFTILEFQVRQAFRQFDEWIQRRSGRHFGVEWGDPGIQVREEFDFGRNISLQIVVRNFDSLHFIACVGVCLGLLAFRNTLSNNNSSGINESIEPITMIDR